MVGDTNVEDQTGSCILDRLEPSDAGRRKTEEDTVEELEPRQHQTSPEIALPAATRIDERHEVGAASHNTWQ